MIKQGLNATQAAAAQGVTAPTARKWLSRFLAGGANALSDATSRPNDSPRSIEPPKALLIVELRQCRMLQRQIAKSVGVCTSTVNRVTASRG